MTLTALKDDADTLMSTAVVPLRAQPFGGFRPFIYQAQPLLTLLLPRSQRDFDIVAPVPRSQHVPRGGACCHQGVDGAMQMVLEVLHQITTPGCHACHVLGLVKTNHLRTPRFVLQSYGQRLMSLDRSTQGGSRSCVCLSIDSQIAEVSV